MYWTNREGKKVATNKMNASYLRRILHMLIRKAGDDKDQLAFLLDCILKGKEELIANSNNKFRLNGDIAQLQLDSDSEDDDCDATEFDIY